MNIFFKAAWALLVEKITKYIFMFLVIMTIIVGFFIKDYHERKDQKDEQVKDRTILLLNHQIDSLQNIINTQLKEDEMDREKRRPNFDSRRLHFTGRGNE